MNNRELSDYERAIRRLDWALTGLSVAVALVTCALFYLAWLRFRGVG